MSADATPSRPSRPNRSLDGAVAVVTGASSGIGAATARALAERGATVALLARRRERLDDLADELNQDRPDAARAYPVDVADTTAVTNTIHAVAADLGGIDVLVNGAGVGTWSPALEADLADWKSMVDVNVTGVLAATHAALPHLVSSAQGPRGIADLVMVSSIAGRRVPTFHSNVYAATKHAITAFGEALRQELAEQHVRVGLVEPGIVETEMTTSGGEHTPDARTPTGLGFLEPDDIADAIVYLVSRPPHAAVNEVLIRPSEQSR